MSAFYTVDHTLQVSDYWDKVVKAKAFKNVIQTIIKRGPTPEQWKQQIEIEGAPTPTDLAAPEGTDFDETGLDKRVNGYLEVQLQKFRSIKGFQVTDEAQAMPGWTEKKGEKQLARQQRRDAEELAYSIDCTLGSLQEAVERGSSSSTRARTRGMMSWLAPNTAHSVQAIPSGFRPQAGISGDVTSGSVFNEALFKAELFKSALEGGDEHLQLVGLVGLKLKALMSDWLGKAKTVSGMDQVLQRTEPKSRKIELICDEFAYDSVSVRTITCNHIGGSMPVTGGGDPNPGGSIDLSVAKYCGAFIRPEFWSIDPLLPMRKRMLENKGGGERGYHEAILRLACRNPLSQFRVLYSA